MLKPGGNAGTCGKYGNCQNAANAGTCWEYGGVLEIVEIDGQC